MKSSTRKQVEKSTVECLACSDDIYVGQNPKIGNFVICNGCDAEFQIVDLDPVLIEWPDFDDYIDEEEGYYDDISSDDDY